MKPEPTSERLEAPVLIAVKIPRSLAVKLPTTACTVAIESIPPPSFFFSEIYPISSEKASQLTLHFRKLIPVSKVNQDISGTYPIFNMKSLWPSG